MSYLVPVTGLVRLVHSLDESVCSFMVYGGCIHF